jgi:hypothetical protein
MFFFWIPHVLIYCFFKLLYLEKVAFSSKERDLNSDLLTNKEIIEPFIKKQKEKNEKEIEKIHDDEINDEKLIKNSYTETINKKDKVKEIANIITNQKEKIFELDDEYVSLIQVKNDKENNNNDKILTDSLILLKNLLKEITEVSGNIIMPQLKIRTFLYKLTKT